MSTPMNRRRALRFDHLRQHLPEPGRTLLLKEAVFELAGAWKFMTRLPADGAVFFYLPGFSALPVSFARHVARVDVFGLAQEERELLAEIAAAKALSNIRCLQSASEMRAPYATLVCLPGGERFETDWQEITARLGAGAGGAEEYWFILRQAQRHRIMRQGKKILRRLLLPRREIIAATTRFCFMAAPPPVAHAAGLLPAAAHAERLMLALPPHFSAPKVVSVAREAGGALSDLRSHQPLHAEHVVCGQRPAGHTAFFERLLLHLNRLSNRAWQPTGALRVLPGGKVQVVLHQHSSARSEAALLKMPLIPHAAARMRENALNLLRLAGVQELLPEQRRVFPHHLEEGLYETQAYYLEGFLPGSSLDQTTGGGSSAFHQAVFNLWFEVQQRLARRVMVNEGVFAGLLGNLAMRLHTWLSPAPPEAARLQRIVTYCRQVFCGRELMLGLVHGDFSAKNILGDAASRQVTGVIDWDLADFFSVPLLDVLHFFVRLDARSFRDPSPAIAWRLTQTASGRHAPYFGEACARFGYRQEDWPAAVILYWLFRQRGYIGSDKNMDPKFVRRQISDMLDLFERKVLAPRAGVVA